MQRAPDDKRPGRAVPEPADQERQDQVAIKIDAALAQSAERNEDVIEQPVGKGDMPAPPEIAKAYGSIRRIEVRRQLETQQQRRSDSDIRVTGKVAIVLECVTVNCAKRLDR